MRPKSLILIVFALGCGLVASIGISQVLESKNQQAAVPQMEMENIFVAIEDIDINEPLTPELIKLEPWPKDKVPEGAVTNLEELENRRPRVRLYAGEPILERKLFGSNEDKGASKMIPAGFRVHSVRVTAESSASGLILPGDRVDVLVYLRSSGAINKTLTRTILKNVRVFAVNEQTHRETDSEGNSINAKTVSLLVKPSQVEILMLASQLGQLSLSLRPPNEDGVEEEDETDDATVEELLGVDEDADPKKKRKPVAAAKDDSGGFLGFLQNYGGSTPIAQPTEAGPQWTMDLLDPNGVRRFEFGEEGMLPMEVAPGASNAPAAAPVSLPMQGLGNAPMPFGPGLAPNGAGSPMGHGSKNEPQGSGDSKSDDASQDDAAPLGLDD
ncbi:Flp pilus assembly protein CpaB [Blastopirellula sp. JC732]|uniref:Flp pilus assembly protein CpaB n=1 Tax=Blastopirellula sediminis TaxID=2894196 RepID=A0A9X1MID7_9BACT|nr:Flp pilus assembly protein CpaB [Blastopirellula sediminis]MCC9609576.1 Flp pilus assembly protein CpaB [Blastopirellula sediminis]MCC9627648.1 Flp pilus assembly protein CpaB [Blastopirellula sediminis]